MQISLNGPVQDGQTVVVDHISQTFTVRVRSLNGVGTDDIKNFLQNKWEVVGVRLESQHEYVRGV